MRLLSRRKFFGFSLLALPAAVGIDAWLIEPTWLRITHLDQSPRPTCRFVHFSDFHYKGDARYAAHVARTINKLKPDFVCFTGDLVEDRRFADEALSFIRQIERPVYGCPGNHDYTSHANFADYERAFADTRGAWLVNRSVVLESQELELVGMAPGGDLPSTEPRARRRILLVHHPMLADRVGEQKFALILAGHSHGGQVRLPFFGAIILPDGVGRYDHGLFYSLGGPLYVNAGIGTWLIPVRFNCRPEITVVRL